MIDKEEFLTGYNIGPEEPKATGLNRGELAAICDDYLSVEGKLRSIGKDFTYDYLYDIERAGVHSYRYRTKDPGRLIEKIIHRHNEHFERFEDINRGSYHKYITDLIEIRVFSLYREDWIHSHKYITSIFENNPDLYVMDHIKDFDKDTEHYHITERPRVYCRNGDTRIYGENLIEIKLNGIYHSLHYVIKYKEYYVEIQGRTLFEEDWSEIDHNTVYPYLQDGEMSKDFSTLLDRLSDMTDEMSSYFRRMEGVKEEREKQSERYNGEG